MNTADNNHYDFLPNLQLLYSKLDSSKDAFKNIYDSKRYLEIDDILKPKYKRRVESLKVLGKELMVLDTTFDLNQNLRQGYDEYDHLLERVKLKGLLVGDVLNEIIICEKSISKDYSEVLAITDLPVSTQVILEAQAERINADIEKLKLDQRTIGKVKPTDISRIEKKSQIRTITD